MWRHGVLPAKKWRAICGDMVCCMGRHGVLHAETWGVACRHGVLHLEAWGAVLPTDNGVLCCQWKHVVMYWLWRHGALHAKTWGAACGDMGCCMR